MAEDPEAGSAAGDAAPPLPGYVLADAGDPFEMRAGPFYMDPDSGAGHSRLALRIAERHCNSGGVVHGGLLMTMMDLCLAMTARSEPEIDYVFTVSMSAEFVESGRPGDLVEAHGELVRPGRSLAFVRGQVRAGERVLLNASAVFKLRRRRSEADG